MYLENNKSNLPIIALLGLLIGAIILGILFLNQPQTYRTPASTRLGPRSVVCRWDTTSLPFGFRLVISLLDSQGKVIRAIPNPPGNSFRFDDIDPSAFPAKCRLDLIPAQAGLEACVEEAPVTCQGLLTDTPIPPTNTPTPAGPTNTPGPSQKPTNTPVPAGEPTTTPKLVGPTNTPVPTNPPVGGPSQPTNTPVPLGPTSTPRVGGPTSTPAPTNTSVPLKQPTKFPELPKSGINTPTMLIVAMGVVILLLAFAL